MVIDRYARSPIIRGGSQYGTSTAAVTLKRAVDVGAIAVEERVLQGRERLDVLAGQLYGDSRNWWIIAAASGIGWALQVPPGTRLLIPTDLSQVNDIIG